MANYIDKIKKDNVEYDIHDSRLSNIEEVDIIFTEDDWNEEHQEYRKELTLEDGKYYHIKTLKNPAQSVSEFSIYSHQLYSCYGQVRGMLVFETEFTSEIGFITFDKDVDSPILLSHGCVISPTYEY